MAKTVTVGPEGQGGIPVAFRDALAVQLRDSVGPEKKGTSLGTGTKAVTPHLGGDTHPPTPYLKERIEKRRKAAEKQADSGRPGTARPLSG